jgi:heterodisulfide reductase subunit C
VGGGIEFLFVLDPFLMGIYTLNFQVLTLSVPYAQGIYKVSMSGIQIDSQFLNEVEAAMGRPISACYQCRKCSVGCPVSYTMDLLPHQVIRLVQFGQKERVLNAATPWICAACETCTTRCPNEIDIAGVMDHLKNLAFAEGRSIPESNVLTFHRAFLSVIRKRGRIFEADLLPRYMLKSGEVRRMMADGTLIDEIKLGLTLLKKGRMKMLPPRIKGRRDIAEIIKKV